MKTLPSLLTLLAAAAPLVACAQAAAAAAEPAASPPAWEGALGLILSHEPRFVGSGEQINKGTPAVYLRYGRYSITNAGIFVNRARSEVLRGASADLLRTDALRMNLALRLDNGRRESQSGQLRGLGDVRRTLRGRLSVTWQPADDWRVSAGLSPDLLGRGGGNTLDLGIARDWPLGARQALSVSAGMLWGDRTYLQERYGVTAEQAAASGLAQTRLGGGQVSFGLTATVRREFGERWIGFVGAGSTHFSRAMRASPVLRSPSGWSVSSGLAWRF